MANTFYGIRLLWGFAQPDLDISPLVIERSEKEFAIAVDGNGARYAIEMKGNQAIRLLPYVVATDEDNKRTDGRLKTGQPFVKTNSPIHLKPQLIPA